MCVLWYVVYIFCKITQVHIEGLEAELIIGLKWDNVLVNMDYKLSFCRKGDYVQYKH